LIVTDGGCYLLPEELVPNFENIWKQIEDMDDFEFEKLDELLDIFGKSFDDYILDDLVPKKFKVLNE
jgi:hypothetical protein